MMNTNNIWLKVRNSIYLKVIIISCVLYVILKIITPQITVGNGYGWDSIYYGQMSESFSFNLSENSSLKPFNYRVLPSLIVFFIKQVTGLHTFTCFHILNFLSYVLSCITIAKILQFFQRKLCYDEKFQINIIVSVIIFSLMHVNLRVWLGAPVLTDAFATLMSLIILYAIISNKVILYILFMILGVLSRENLLVFVFYMVAYNYRKNNFSIKLLAYQLPVICIFLISRVYPIFKPLGEYSFLGTALYFSKLLLEPLTLIKIIISAFNGLGILLMLMIIFRNDTLEFLKNYYEWIIFSIFIIILSVIGGSDTDRFFSWLFPLGLIVFINISKYFQSLDTYLIIILSQLVLMGSLYPFPPNEDFILKTYAAHAFYSHPKVFIAITIKIAVIFLVNLLYFKNFKKKFDFE